MDMVNIWKTVVLQRYAKFDGRAGRAEFWWFALANFLAYLVLAILMGIADIFFVLYLGYWIATIVPSLAVGIRRLHDTDKSGWFLLLSLIPFVGAIILIVFLASRGHQGAEQLRRRRRTRLSLTRPSRDWGLTPIATVSGGSGVGR